MAWMRRWSYPLVFVLLSSAGLSGCLQGDGGTLGTDGSETTQVGSWTPWKTPDIPTYDFRQAFDVVHAHDVRQLHTESHNLRLVGYTDLLDGLAPHAYSGGYIEVEVKGHLAVVASLTGMRAFTLVDISDVRNPTVLSHFYSGNDNWDVRISDDLQYVFVGCQGTGLYTSTPIGDCTDYDGIPTVGGNEKMGIITVDISNPRNPTPVCWTPSKSNHNIFTATNETGSILVVNNQVEIFVMEEDGCLTKLAEVPGRHDAHLQIHPITGEMLLYTGTNTLSIYNVDDPSNPVDIGTMDSAGFPGATGWHEQSPAPALFGGIHITMGGGERFSGQPGVVTVINTTDPQVPVAMGTWKLPVSVPLGDERFYGQQSYMFSEHNIWVNQWGQACIGHYHAGVWVIDISTPERMADPVTLGFYLPHEIAPVITTTHPAGGAMTSSPYVWGCDFTEDGRHVVIPDMTSGLYILEGMWFEPLDATEGL